MFGVNARTTLLAFLFALTVVPALADWNGTWVGNWSGGDGVQIIMSGNEAAGMFWRGDYVSDGLHSAVSADGKVLTIRWDHNQAVLTRISDDAAQIVVHEPNRPDSAFVVKLDR